MNLSFLRMASVNPNLGPRGKLEWMVFAFAYSAAILLHYFLTFFVVVLPIIRVNRLIYRAFMAVYCSYVLMLLFLNI